MLLQHVVEGAVDDFQAWRRPVALAPSWRIAGSQQQRVLLPQRQVHRRGQAQDHVAARRSAAGLDEAQMPLGRPRHERERELRITAAYALLLQQPAETLIARPGKRARRRWQGVHR